MADKIEITYKITDGYVGNRPQTFSVDPEDFVGYNREQVASLLDNMATEHMQQRVSADIVDPDDALDRVMKAVDALDGVD